MPLIEKSDYRLPSFIFKNPHVSTIFMGKFKKSRPPAYKRYRLELQDGDFLDIDFMEKQTDKAVILCHGLEGASYRTYNNTAAEHFLSRGFSVYAWNNRSCSGEMNRLPRLYHHASVEDLNAVIEYVAAKNYKAVYLLGFSLGGAQILNLFGREKVHPAVKAGVSVSVPIHLKSSAEKLKKGFNRVYLYRFIRHLRPKIYAKAAQFPGLIDTSFVKEIRSFDEIDENLTAPLHGFKDREDYYLKASPAYSIENIQRPILILNSLDDPFLGEDSYPVEFAKNNAHVYLETPRYGGHCAFPMKGLRHSYSEIRAAAFFSQFD